MILTSQSDSKYGVHDKFFEEERVDNLLYELSKPETTSLIKTASTGSGSIEASERVLNMLAKIGMKLNVGIQELMAEFAKEAEKLDKLAESSKKVRKHDVRITSKKVQDSHYFIYLSLDEVKKYGKSVVLVSAYMQEGYLGRYLIKRNFYFLPKNKSTADDLFESMIGVFEVIKEKYYNEDIKITDIFPMVKKVLDESTGDLEPDKDSEDLGTTVKRDKKSGHTNDPAVYIKDWKEWSGRLKG